MIMCVRLFGCGSIFLHFIFFFVFFFFFFFFQAEDGIRDIGVTGSDVCSSDLIEPRSKSQQKITGERIQSAATLPRLLITGVVPGTATPSPYGALSFVQACTSPRVRKLRSEERRVGKECRSRW